MLGKYNTNVVLPKSKNELIKQINSLGQVEIRVIEPVTEDSLRGIQQELKTRLRLKKGVSLIIIVD